MYNDILLSNKLWQDVSLFTDFYQLTMAQAQFLGGRHLHQAYFDYFFRKAPFNGSFAVFAGLGDLIEALNNFQFTDKHLAFLKKFNFHSDFIEYLSTLRFTGSIRAVLEGEIVFAHTPVLQVTAPIIEAQIIESFLLNILNYQTLVATKALRMKFAAGDRALLEFGLRRAQGWGAIQGSKAATIGGFSASSNVLAGQLYDLNLGGTMAHAWVQSFDDEITAFRFFAKMYPENCTLLVDTYDTIRSGVPNAIIVAKELETEGKQLRAIRLDSGDLAEISKKARKMLDNEGLNYVKISATNDLDEYIIKSLIEQGAQIDTFGVGTRLITSSDQPALGGVYKLVQLDDDPRIKISENFNKTAIPSIKNIFRFYKEGKFYADALAIVGEEAPNVIFHPYNAMEYHFMDDLPSEPLHHSVFEEGVQVMKTPTAYESATVLQERLSLLPDSYKRFEFPQKYIFGISSKLKTLMEELVLEKKGLKKA